MSQNADVEDLIWVQKPFGRYRQSILAPPVSTMQSLPMELTKQMGGCPVRRVQRGSSSGRGQLQVVAAQKKRSMKHVVFSKTLVAKKAYLGKLKRECKTMSDYAEKSMKDSENGIMGFDVFQDPFDELQIHFFERYQDSVKMGKFNSGDRFVKFMKDVQKYIEKPVGFALYEWDNGRLGSASVQGGPKGE